MRPFRTIKSPRTIKRPAEILLQLAMLLMAVAVVLLVHRYVNQLWREPALRAAKAYSESVSQFRSYYTNTIVVPLREKGIQARHDYAQHPGSIPLPATMTIEMGLNAHRQGAGVTYRLISDYPFSWRTDRQVDDFVRTALDHFESGQTTPFYKFLENTDGSGVTLRYAEPVTMGEACVACHNTHTESPKTDWAVGDIRGVQEVEMLFEPSIAGPWASPSTIVIAITTILTICVGGLIWVLVQRRHVLHKSAHLAETKRQQSLELSRTLTALEESESRIRATVESAMDAVVTMDSGGIVLDFNPAAEDIFGFTKDQAIGQRMSDLIIPEEHRRAHEDGLKRYLKTGEGPVLNKRIQIEAVTASGNKIPVELAISVAKTTNGDIFVGYIRDITDRLQHEDDLKSALQSAEQAIKVKSQFLAVMSHEIRTPINGILGVLGMIQDTHLDGDQKTFIETGLASADHLLNVVNDILDFSKIEAGKMELEATDFNLADLLDSVTDMLKYRATDPTDQIHIKVVIDTTVPKWIHGDPGRISQILVNLGANAVKFTSQGSVTFRVSVLDAQDSVSDHASARDIKLRLAVTDTGIGISEDQIDRLFSEFATVDPSYSRKYGGTGLGLAICKKLVDLMDGEIGCRSTVGCGSTFWFDIPVKGVAIPETADIQSSLATLADTPADEDFPDTANAAAQPARVMSRDVPVRILLAEDNPTNRMVAKHMIESAGYRVDTASNGIEAVEAVSRRPYDLVLMDISMPEMDGLEATRQIRSMAGRKSNIPIIAMTAHVTMGAKEHFVEKSMNDFLPKPERKDRILAKIAEWTQHRDWDKLQEDHHQSILADADQTAQDTEAAPILDAQTYTMLEHDLGAEQLQDIAGSFIKDAQVRCDAVLQFLQEGRFKEAELNAHSLASTSATFGLMALSKIARHIEHDLSSGSLHAAQGQSSALQEHFDDGIKALENHIATKALPG